MLQPFKRENKRTKARDAARAANAAQAEATPSSAADFTEQVVSGSNGSAIAGGGPPQPQAGDVVEYPLSELQTREARPTIG